MRTICITCSLCMMCSNSQTGAFLRWAGALALFVLLSMGMMPGAYGTTLATGSNSRHTCAVDSDTSVKCWGASNFGQLGNGTTATFVASPVAVTGLTGATAVSTGTAHSCALINDGTVKCWGYNGSGLLGDGTTTQSSIPVVVSGLPGATAVATGNLHSCALINNGTVKCWGDNSYGQLGNGTTTQSFIPVVVSGLSGATAVATGDSHGCALLSDGKVKCWGDNSKGQLGNGNTTNSTTPVMVSGLTGATAVAASGGYDYVFIYAHSCALINDGTVKCWGANNYGQLGDGTNSNSSTPVTVSGLTNATALTVGLKHSCALINDGKVKCWGDNANVGSGYPNNTSGILATVSDLTSATAVTASVTHSCALINDGTVKCWGENYYGQLGNGGYTYSTTPVAVSGLTEAIAVATGGNQYSFTELSTRYVAYTHSCARINDGTVKCWGYNGSGELGNGSTATFVASPVAVSALTGATAVATGNSNSCALINDGTVKCWGANNSGQLGNGTTAMFVASPVAVSALTGATAVATGNGSNCALINDGTVRCWGDNTSGQLGNGTTATFVTSPVAVSALTGATAVATGNGSSCALINNGTVKCWGANNSGQLGNGTAAAFVSSPVAVSTLTGATAVTTGNGNSCALINDGTVKCWGDNTYGQLGNGLPLHLVVPSTVANFPLNLVPQGLVATALSGSSVGLSWSAVASATGYDIQVAASPTGAFSSASGSCAPAIANASTALSCTATGLTNGVVYYFRVAAVSSHGVLSYSLAVPQSFTHLINLSTRGQVQTGDNVMIGGFVIGAVPPANKTVLIRAVGPTLSNYGVTGVLANPTLTVFSGQTVIASNDDWGTASNAAAILATGLAPVNSLESAVLATLSPGAYTAVVAGFGGGTGVGIVEVYEIDHPEYPLVNISTRGQVLTGNNVMIGGFIIQGTTNQTVLVRAVGPNLANYGVTGVLANPTLQLFSGQAVIATNDDWETASNATAIQATGLAPANPLESAILISLPPGAYTAVVSGSGGGTGVGIVEVFAR